MQREQSLSDAMVKHIGYGSEEWIKQVLMEVDNVKISLMKPYVGSVMYPGILFPPPGSNVPILQFQQTTYVGLMEMVFPVAEVNPDLDGLPAYTLVQFDLDGVTRQFLQIAGGAILAGAQSFRDFMASVFPDANQAIPFNASGFHVLRNISISGCKFDPSSGAFVPTGAIAGSQTKDYSCCISISGYSIIVA